MFSPEGRILTPLSSLYCQLGLRDLDLRCSLNRAQGDYQHVVWIGFQPQRSSLLRFYWRLILVWFQCPGQAVSYPCPKPSLARLFPQGCASSIEGRDPERTFIYSPAKPHSCLQRLTSRMCQIRASDLHPTHANHRTLGGSVEFGAEITRFKTQRKHSQGLGSEKVKQ